MDDLLREERIDRVEERHAITQVSRRQPPDSATGNRGRLPWLA